MYLKIAPGCSVCEKPATNNCEVPGCGWRGADIEAMSFVHVSPSPDTCDHNFTGWREFDDGLGGERVCSKCDMGAMAYSLRTGL